jgi:hypothetical protein
MVRPHFDPAVEIYADKYRSIFPISAFRDQEFREGETSRWKTLQ